MATAKIRDYGTAEFDPTAHDGNIYDLYDIAICDPDTDEIIEEEHYTTEGEYLDAINGTIGREVLDEQTEYGYCQVTYDTEDYECPATYHIAYVYDTEE